MREEEGDEENRSACWFGGEGKEKTKKNGIGNQTVENWGEEERL